MWHRLNSEQKEHPNTTQFKKKKYKEMILIRYRDEGMNEYVNIFVLGSAEGSQ